MSAGAPSDLSGLWSRLDPDAPLAERHLWLIELLDWVRGDRKSVEACVARVQLLVEALEAVPERAAKLRLWWQRMLETVDMTTLLADFGFAQRTALVTELSERLRLKVLPSSPETIDASELFGLALPSRLDAMWLRALPASLLERAVALLSDPQDQGTRWQRLLLDAMTYCAGQILSTGFAPELRLRMSEAARDAQPFHALVNDVHHLRVEVLHGLRTPERRDAAAATLRARLLACQGAADTVYEHFEDNGISVGLVFRLRQLQERITRIGQLLDTLLCPSPAVQGTQLLAHLVDVAQERRSIRALLSENSSLLAARVAERSAETGEHYITRDRPEYFAMVRRAAGGGLVMGLTTLVKFALYGLVFSAFWGGFWAGMNYAISFVLIQMLHFTVATKQPAMTAPAMATALKEASSSSDARAFSEKIAQLVRTQVAAVLGNVLVVFPVALLLCVGWELATGETFLTAAKAEHTMESLHLLGPSALYAAFTGVLLFASSLIAGWAENWFVLQRMDSAIEYNPRVRRWLGVERAARWSRFLRHNISGLAANISLGMMLGLIPVFGQFFGLELDIRHVTLAAGQMGASAATLGLEVLHTPAFWWGIACLPVLAFLNVGVSFVLAFRLALTAQKVSLVNRKRLYAALRQRLRIAPWSFFFPEKSSRTEPTEPPGGTLPGSNAH